MILRCLHNFRMDELKNLMMSLILFMLSGLPDLKFPLMDRNIELVLSFKVMLAFKRKRFGQAWLGTFRLQAEALWPGSFWWVYSSNGSVLLETFSVCHRNFKLSLFVFWRSGKT